MSSRLEEKLHFQVDEFFNINPSRLREVNSPESTRILSPHVTVWDATRGNYASKGRATHGFDDVLFVLLSENVQITSILHDDNNSTLSK